MRSARRGAGGAASAGIGGGPRGMRIASYGSSLLSSVWNRAATYYRVLIRGLDARGHEVAFFEPRAYGRQERADIAPPPWCRVTVHEPDAEGLAAAAAEAASFDAVIVASGIGTQDDLVGTAVWGAARPGALRHFWDVDAPATLAELEGAERHPLRPWLPRLDLVLTYGGGAPVVARYGAIGTRRCEPIYNALDPETHRPVPPDPRFRADLVFLGNRLLDREARAARLSPDRRFLLGGSGWGGRAMPPDVRALGHVSTREHNALNATPLAVLAVSRESMAANGHSPATRAFEAAGAGACLVTDAWEGIEAFLKPGEEILVAHDGVEVARHLRDLTPERAQAIGEGARRRVLAEHTYDRRAEAVERLLAAKGQGRAA